MNPLIPIRGAGSKGASGGARAPVELPDGLRAKAYARIIDMIQEGEMEGLCDPSQKEARSGLLLSNGTLVGPAVVSGGAIQNNLVAVDGSLGYPPKFYLNVDGDGKDAVILGSADEKGKITSIQVLNGGSGYTQAKTKVSIPPIEGLAVFFDDLPLSYIEKIKGDANGAYAIKFSFPDTAIISTPGTVNQSPLKGFERAEQVISPNTWPAQFTVSGPKEHGGRCEFTGDLDKILVGVSVPSLRYQRVNSKGLIIEGTTVTYSVYVTYTPTDRYGVEQPGIKHFLKQITITGKASSKYTRTDEISLGNIRDSRALKHVWLFELTRETPDNTDSMLENDTYAEFIVGINNTPYRYPYSALVGIDINAEQFNRIPVRGYERKGLKVLVPNTYFPIDTFYASGPKKGTRRKRGEYNRSPSGEEIYDENGDPVDQIWDGNFYLAWTSNPAWCFYDLVMNDRYGLGQYISKTYGGADKWTLYTIGKYCDELVEVAVNNSDIIVKGSEPRFTCNLFIQERQDAYRVLQDLAGIFRGMLYWASGSIIAVQDAPKKAVLATQTYRDESFHAFTNADVKDGIFNYSGTARQARRTIFYVKWNDPTDGYKPKWEAVPDVEAILKYGIREYKIDGFGCTSQGQAHRQGRYLLFSEQNETDTVNFRCGLKGAILRPGDIIAVFDNARSAVNYGGRIKDIRNARTSVVTDRAVDLEGSNFSAIFITPRPIVPPTEISNSEDIEKLRQSQLSEYKVNYFDKDEDGNLLMVFKEPVSPDVEIGSIWGLRSEDIYPQFFRILGVEEISKHEYEVMALAHYPKKFDAIEKDLQFNKDPISRDPQEMLRPYPVDGLFIDVEVSEEVSGTKKYRLNTHWGQPVIRDENGEFIAYAYVSAYSVWLKQGLGNYRFYSETTSNQIDIDVPGPDDYCVKVYSIGLNNARSAPVEECVSIDETDGIAKDEIVTGLELFGKGNIPTFEGGTANFDWRINSKSNSYDFGSEPYSTGANSGGNSANFYSYIIKVIDPDTGNVVWNAYPKDSEYSFTYDMNSNLQGGPYRDFIFEVRARLKTGAVSLPERIRVYNALPNKLLTGDVGITSSYGIAYFTFPPFSATDVVGRRIWLSESPINLDPITGKPTITPAYEGRANPATLPVKHRVLYYARFAEYDDFSNKPNDCIPSDQVTFIGDNPPRLSSLDFMR